MKKHLLRFYSRQMSKEKHLNFGYEEFARKIHIDVITNRHHMYTVAILFSMFIKRHIQ